MSPNDVKEFEALLAEYAEADHSARIASARKANAHIALVRWVAVRVPAGIVANEALDIPSFLRRDND